MKSKRKAKKTGPKAETLKIEGPAWQEAMKKAMGKKKPKTGWPKKEK